MKNKWDYIVIGAGSAGSALAGRLARKHPGRVLVLEAGRSDLHPYVYVPAWQMKMVGNPAYDWCYPVEPDPSRDGRTDHWPAGKLMGGGSSINGMVYVRGHAADYQQWVDAGAEGWGYADVLPYYRRAERNARGADAWHGDDGPIGVDDTRASRPLNALLLEAAQRIGHRRNDDSNGAEQEGIGWSQSTIRNGLRSNASREYLHDLWLRGQVSIVTHATVQRIDIEGGRAVGVTYVHEGRSHSVRANHEVLLCAGAIGSPKLLMLSGIGDPQVLAQHGIACHSPLPGVGANLQEHPGVIVRFDVDSPTLNVETRPLDYVKHALQFALMRRGAATTGIAHIVGFLKTQPDLSQPDVQLHFAPFTYEHGTNGTVLVPTRACGVAVNVCRPVARGRISLRSADPAAPPLIEHQLLSEPADVDTLIRGARIARALFGAEPLKSVTLGERDPGPAVQSDAQWEQFLRQASFPMYHPVGTCKMGRADDSMAVLDPALRVRGIAGLRVVDASVMPTLVSANTNACAIMIGEKAADLVLASGSR